MIFEALQILVFGMLGIFIVMGIIILTISLLKRFSGGSPHSEIPEENTKP